MEILEHHHVLIQATSPFSSREKLLPETQQSLTIHAATMVAQLISVPIVNASMYYRRDGPQNDYDLVWYVSSAVQDILGELDSKDEKAWPEVELDHRRAYWGTAWDPSSEPPQGLRSRREQWLCRLEDLLGSCPKPETDSR